MNPLYQSYQQNQNGNPGGLPKTAPEMMAFLKSRMMTPEQKVRQMLKNREMTQEQFEYLGQMADKLLGHRR